ncbi:MAG: hypothetical protein ACHREM_08880 [Polyangiales bacterium]
MTTSNDRKNWRSARIAAMGGALGLLATACSDHGAGAVAAGSAADASVPTAAISNTTSAPLQLAARGVGLARFDVSHARMQMGRASWTMELAQYGRVDAMHSAAADTPSRDGDRVSYVRAEGIREWYALVPRGLEQGFTIEDRPEGTGALRLELGDEGMTPRAVGDRIALLDLEGRQLAWYGDLRIVDAHGAEVPGRLLVDGGRIVITVDDARAAYPIEIDPTAYNAGTALLPDTTYSGGEFGAAVATDGTTVFVGEPLYNGQGTVYLYTASSGTWSQTGRISASFGGGQFGASVAQAGAWMFVGGPTSNSNAGLIEGFMRNPDGSWPTSYSFQFEPTSGSGPQSRFGSALAFDGTTLVIGAPGLADSSSNANAGGIWVYALGSDGGWYGANDTGLVTWTSNAPTGGQLCGSSVAVSGATILVGCGGGTGALAQFSVTPPTPGTAAPWPIVTWKNEFSGSTGTGFGGVALATNGYGLFGLAQSTSSPGAVNSLSSSSGNYSTISSFNSASPANNDGFGAVIAFSGNAAIIGAPSAAPGNGSAWQYLLDASSGNWTFGQQLIANDRTGAGGDGFGQAVAINGNTVVVGAPTKNGSGEAYVFSPPVGGACALASDCATGFCVDGYCCNSACGGTCQACDVSGATGICTTLTSGQPHGSRTHCAGTGVCQGTCNGSSKTACVYPTSSKACAAANCTGTTLTAAATCDGAGICNTPTTSSCSPYECGTGACKTSCTGDSDCIATDYCSSGKCAAKLANGQPATLADQCTSGIVADGVCCSAACTDVCDACTVSGHVGTCSPVTGAPATGHGACTGDGSACGGRCDGTHTTTCANPGATASCRSASCTSGLETLATPCNGTGVCPAAVTSSCGAYNCGATACKTSCTADTDCISGDYCSSGACTPQLANGSPATTAHQCASGVVADGVCCNTACADVCDACNVGGHVGTCTAVPVGNPATGHGSCTTDGSACGGSCDGTTKTACTYPKTTTECIKASCASGVETLQTFCDGAGHCPTPTTTACTPFLCSGTACGSSCTSNAQCVSGKACSGGICGTPLSNGSACSSAAICNSGFCANGICCDAACTDGCDACNVAGHAGVCTPVAAKSAGAPSCSPYVCDGTSTTCPKSCTTDASCATGSVCSGGVCTGKLANGSPATNVDQCASGIIADGVCCNAACTDVCDSCNSSASRGTCSPITGAPATGHGTCTGTGTSCVGTCDGVHATSCAYPGNTTTCGSVSCTGGTAKSAPACDGAGHCGAATSTPCTPYVCSGNACGTSCTTDSDCATGIVCNGGVCGSPLANGATCTAGSVCETGNCVDGVCCSTACKGTCTACVKSKTGTTDGTCASVTAGTDPDLECTAATCTGATLTTNTCGTGGCTPVITSCAPGTCNVSGTACSSGSDAGADAIASDATDGGVVVVDGGDAEAVDAAGDSTASEASSDGSIDDTSSSTDSVAEPDGSVDGSSDAGNDSTIDAPNDAPNDAPGDATDGSVDASGATCTTPGASCGDGMTCNDLLECVPGVPVRTGCGCTIPGERSEPREVVVGAIGLLAIGLRRRARRQA